MAVANHGDATGHGGIWKGCTETAGCYELDRMKTDWYFQAGAKAAMQAGDYYHIADRNWPAIQNESAHHAWAPYCFNTNFVA